MEIRSQEDWLGLLWPFDGTVAVSLRGHFGEYLVALIEQSRFY